MVATAGLIANPASGTDIRRLVAHASVFGNDEKINIVRRAVLGMAAAGVRRLIYMPDPYHIVERALERAHAPVDAEAVEGSFYGDASDTTRSAAAMQSAGAGAIVSLGGDGTNRALTRGTRDVPLVPVSTGTNNVFPTMIEGTVAGLAAGLVATGALDAERVGRRCKVARIDVNGVPRDLALVDVAVMGDGFVGSRAIWDANAVREVVLTRAHAHAVGMAAVGGMLDALEPDEDAALHVLLGEGDLEILAPIAPGMLEPVRVASWHRIELGASVDVAGPALIGLDGEREFSLRPGERAQISVDRSGPPVIDVAACLAAARDARLMRRGGLASIGVKEA